MTTKQVNKQETVLANYKDYSQDSFTDVQIKDEPEDAGYDKSATLSDYNSAADSRDSSPLPPVHFENPSPQHISSPVTTLSTQIPLNDLFAGSTVRSQLQGAISSKKMDTIQNIIEGLLKKNETLLAMSDAGLHKPRSHQPKSVQDTTATLSGQSSCTFPVSTSLQAHVHSGKKNTDTLKTRMKRPKSPTLRHASVLKDKTNFTYALMESSVIDPEMEKIFNVQKHELVCGVGSRSYIEEQSQKQVVLDVNHYWCNFCPYTTTSKSLLVHHTLDHRFACKFCAYESFCRSDIVRHMYKRHSEFKETAGRFYYCTFLSDYLRVKSCVEQNEKKGSDEDIDASHSHSLTSSKGRKRKPDLERSSKTPSKKSSKLDLELPESTTFTENGCADNSKLTDLPQIQKASKDSDYDMFEMEVEEIREPSQDNSEDYVPERIIYSLNHESPNPYGQVKESVPFPTNLVKVIAPRKNNNQSPPLQPLKNIPTNSRSKSRTEKSGRSSNLYWSCGYCTFQSSSQSEIKEHSYVEHIGKPHRYVALIKHKNPQGAIPASQKNLTLQTSGLKSSSANSTDLSCAAHQTNTFSPQSSNNSFLSDGTEDLESVDVASSKEINSVKVKMKPVRPASKENVVYTCYHCAYSVRRPSSLKSHIYYKHRGKCLVAVDFDSEHRKHIFFCARDDCSFKTETADEFLHHVDQCTPWNKPAQADIEVEPHIRQCLEETVEFAKNAGDKVIENEMERQLNNQRSDFEPLFVSSPKGEKNAIDCLKVDCFEPMDGDHYNRILVRNVSEKESDCDSVMSESTNINNGLTCLDLDKNVNVLSQSLSSDDSFLPVGFIDVKCNLPSDDFSFPRRHQIFEHNLPHENTPVAVDKIIEASDGIGMAHEHESSQSSRLDETLTEENETAGYKNSERQEITESEQNLKIHVSESEVSSRLESPVLKDCPNELKVSESLTYVTEDVVGTHTSESPFLKDCPSDQTLKVSDSLTDVTDDGLETQISKSLLLKSCSSDQTLKVSDSQLDVTDDGLETQASKSLLLKSCSSDQTLKVSDSLTDVTDDGLETQTSKSLLLKNCSSNQTLKAGDSQLDVTDDGLETQTSKSLLLKGCSSDQTLKAGNSQLEVTDGVIDTQTSLASSVESEKATCDLSKDDNCRNKMENKNRLGSLEGDSAYNAKVSKKSSIKSPEVTSPLKLTFKLMGNTTVCSISGQTKSKHCENVDMDSSSTSGSDSETELESEKGQVPKWIDELIDSTGDSESDTDSAAFNVSVKEEVQEIKLNSPVKRTQSPILKQTLPCLPARSAAVKALSKMKPVSDEEDELVSYEYSKQKYRVKKSCKKSKSSYSRSLSSSSSLTFDVAPSVGRNIYLGKQASKNKTSYTCGYCSNIVGGPLKKIKSHLLENHGSKLPMVISCLKQAMQKSCHFYVCSYPTCCKLSGTKKGYLKHKVTHQGILTSNKDLAFPGAGSRSFSSSQQVVSDSEMSRLPCRKKSLQPCSVELDMLDMSQVKMQSASACQQEKKYQCLYCTDNFYDSSLSGMKFHYVSEHEGQLMVMRDTEARRAQLPSRIYVCEMPNCECCYINRPDLYHHSKSHKSNSTYIYECVSCGWYSSSHEGATQHLKTAHAKEKNVSLIHMQVSVDEFGQTSKKVM